MLLWPRIAFGVLMCSAVLCPAPASAGSMVEEIAYKFPCERGKWTIPLELGSIGSRSQVELIDQGGELVLLLNTDVLGYAPDVVGFFEYFSACNQAVLSEASADVWRKADRREMVFRADCDAISNMMEFGLVDRGGMLELYDYYQKGEPWEDYQGVSYRERALNLRGCARF